MSSQYALVAMVGSALCWGIGITFTKHLLETIPPWTLLITQVGASVIFLFCVECIRFRKLRRSFSIRALIGTLEPGLAYLFGIMGLTQSSAAHAALLSAAEPILVLPLSALFLCERWSAAMFYWMTLGAGGVLLVTLPTASEMSFSIAQGDLLLLAGTLCAALFVVFSKRYTIPLPAVVVARQQQLCGFSTVVVLGCICGEIDLHSLQSFTFTTWIVSGASGVIQYALAFWLYNFAITRIPAIMAASMLNLIPIVGVLAAWLFLSESIGVMALLGGFCTIAAVFGLERAHCTRERLIF